MIAILIGIVGSLPFVVASIILYQAYRRPAGVVGSAVTRALVWKFWAASLVVAVVFIAASRSLPTVIPAFPSWHEATGAFGRILIFFAAAILVAWLLYAGYRRTRPGALAPRALVLVLALCVLGPATARVLFPDVFTSGDWIAASIALPVGALLFTLDITALLPFRSAGVWIERRAKPSLLWAGRILCFAGAITAAWQLLARDLNLTPALVVFVGLSLIRAAGRLRSRIAPLPKSSVDVNEMTVGALYLRGFGQEAQIFAVAPVAAGARLDVTMQAQGLLYATFDGFLRQEVESAIGPFVALGSPEDCAPPREGATRLYAADSEWMKRLAILAQRATCILMEVGDSKNLRWELAYLRREGLQEKLFILTRPGLPGGADKIRRAILDYLNPKLKSRKIGWSEFADDLSRLGYDLDGDADPGLGSILTFDSNGKAVLLATQAVNPADFVAPIRARVLSTRVSPSP
jgi:hypothetical protein